MRDLLTDFLDSRITDVVKRCREIEATYLLQREGPGIRRSRKGMAANDELRRELYQLVLHCLWNDAMDELDAEARSNGWQKGADSNPFRVGMVAIFKQPKQRPPRSTWDRICMQLLQACRHFIPPVLLDGFLLQCGARGIEEHAGSEALIDGFEGWVTGRLAEALAGDWNLEVDFPKSIWIAAEERATRIEEETMLVARRLARQLASHKHVNRDDDEDWE